jgi:hypothetical protein
MTTTGNSRQLQRSVRVTIGTRKIDRICLKNLETIAQDVNAKGPRIAVTWLSCPLSGWLTGCYGP